MELYQLRSFAAVAELAHLTRAAEKLHISQPAVSAQIKALEDELGVVLFERTPQGMLLTSAGRKLLPEAEKVVAAAQGLKSRARAIKGEVVGRVRVGTVSDPDFVRVGDFLAQAVTEYPLLEIEIHHEVTGVALAKVREGELDAAFYYGSVSPQDWRRCRCSTSGGASSCHPHGATASSSSRGRRSSRCRGSSRRR